MRRIVRRRIVLVLVVLASSAVLWTGAAVAAPSAAGAAALTQAGVTTTIIPAGSVVTFTWTLTPTPTSAITVRFQISSDRIHWRTLRTLTVAAGTRLVRTRWKAPDHPMTRYFRLKTPLNVSNVLRVRVRVR